MSLKPDSTNNRNSLLAFLPRYLLPFSIGAYLVAAQWSPADSTSVASGDSIILIILGLAIGLVSSVEMFSGEAQRKSDRFRFLLAFLFIGWLGLATFVAKGHANFRVSLLGFWQTLAIVGVLRGFIALIQSNKLYNQLLHWSFSLTAGTSAYALYQYFFSMPQTRERFSLFKEEMLREVGISVGTQEAMQFENRLFSTEPIGPFALTNSLAGTLAPVVALFGIVLIGLIINRRCSLVAYYPDRNSEEGSGFKSPEHSWRWVVTGIMILAIASIVLLLTKSRTAWVATAIGLLFGSFALLKQNTKLNSRLLSMGIGALLLFGLLAVSLVAWFDSAILFEAGKSFLYRLEYWQGAWQLAMRSPWIGYGPLAFQSEYTTVKSIVASENPADPHNMWMEVLVCGGFPLVALLMLGTAWLAWTNMTALLKPVEMKLDERIEHPEHANSTRMQTRNAGEASAVRRSGIAFDAGASVVLASILFFGLIVYSVDPKSDLLFSSLAFCLGATVCYFAIRSMQLSETGLWIASLIFALVVSAHFLFSGGWMQPGAMSPLLVGLAGLVRAARECSVRGAPGSAERSTTRSFAVFGMWCVACASFAILTLAPEAKRGPVEQLHLENRLAELPIEEYSTILEASGWDPDPPSWLLRGAFQRLTDRNLGQTTRLTWLDIYKKIKGRWIANDPRNWLVYSQIAIMDGAVLDGCRSAGIDPTGFLEINDIVAESNRATKLNPSSAQVHLQQAVILYWAKDLVGANAALASAAEIDQLTPHADRKLSVSTIWVPSELINDAGPTVQRTQVAGMPGFFQGEPVFSWLRKVIP